MNILLLGNGFDLNHKFPTRYIDFLHTIHFLMINKEKSFITIGDVFGNELLQESNEFIKDAYSVHSKVYKNIELDNQELKRIVSLAENNLWFKYLYGSINKDIGWIDIEKEIIMVIDSFYNFINPNKDEPVFRFLNDKIMFDLFEYPNDKQARYIIEKFDFFYTLGQSVHVRMKCAFIDLEYCLEVPLGSNNYLLNSEKIALELYDSLRELIDILCFYLKWFVDIPSKIMSQHGIVVKYNSCPKEGYVVTFNYTNTCEYLYDFLSPILHIHGNVNSNIVLGINPDEKDELYDMDTTFLQFKKYFQRVFYGTDLDYIRRIKDFKASKKYNNGYTLYVIGHSLDATDKDIIVKLFELSDNIIIFYHSQNAVGRYIRNLVEIYGKEAFDEIRVTKKLQFLPHSEAEWQ